MLTWCTGLMNKHSVHYKYIYDVEAAWLEYNLQSKC